MVDSAPSGTGGDVATAPRGGSRRRGFFAVVAALALLGAAYVIMLRSQRTIPGLRAGGQPIGDVPFAQLDEAVARVTDAFLETRIALVVGSDSRVFKRREVGLIVDREAAKARLLRVGRSGHPLVDLRQRLLARRGHLDIDLPVALDRRLALEFLSELKDEIDRAPIEARLDLEHHTLAAAQPGYLLRVYDSLVALEYAARSGQARVELSSGLISPQAKATPLDRVDISTVLGHFETHYSATGVDSDRTYNLKVGADRLNGFVLEPHQLFSFNQAVGPRTEKEGYRVAPVIAGGELIDGLAGGMCQIASTLHAAAFFAGLEIVSSTPHSRPSSYIPMGLDSTVVYPSVDLKLRNPYDFPIVMHYQVNQGAVKVELLGKERPDRVVFERQIETETPFRVERRPYPEAPAGQQFPLQEGYPGYTLIRRRYIFPKDKVPRWSGPQPLREILAKMRTPPPFREDHWTLRYPPTTEILAVGTAAGGKKVTPPPAHHIRALQAKDKPIFKLLR